MDNFCWLITDEEHEITAVVKEHTDVMYYIFKEYHDYNLIKINSEGSSAYHDWDEDEFIFDDDVGKRFKVTAAHIEFGRPFC